VSEVPLLEFVLDYELVYTMDHEVIPWKMAFFHNPTFMVQFLKITIYKAFGALTMCKPNMEQEKQPCTRK
jgi:hypothetical protein